MMKLFYQGVVAALLAADTNTALTLLQDHQAAFLDPLTGIGLQAELLYYAIKKANVDVIKVLLKLGKGEGLEIPFYHYCGETPLGLALAEGFSDIIPTLLAKADKNFSLLMAVKLNNNRLVDLLLKAFPFKSRFLQYLNLQP